MGSSEDSLLPDLNPDVDDLMDLHPKLKRKESISMMRRWSRQVSPEELTEIPRQGPECDP